MQIQLGKESFILLPHKAIYRPLRKQIILSDLHLGKASHFRKQGIALPAESHLADIDRFEFLLRNWNPKQVILLGDLFHSDINREWLWLKSLFQSHPQREFILVEGNHDILPEKEYDVPNLLRATELEEREYLFSHAPIEGSAKLNFCGHVHPGIRLTGKARQSVTLPCYYHLGNTFILPAFGELTGLGLLERTGDAQVYVVTRETVVKL
jgi:uncharacterized protein